MRQPHGASPGRSSIPAQPREPGGLGRALLSLEGSPGWVSELSGLGSAGQGLRGCPRAGSAPERRVPFASPDLGRASAWTLLGTARTEENDTERPGIQGRQNQPPPISGSAICSPEHSRNQGVTRCGSAPGLQSNAQRGTVLPSSSAPPGPFAAWDVTVPIATHSIKTALQK